MKKNYLRSIKTYLLFLTTFLTLSSYAGHNFYGMNSSSDYWIYISWANLYGDYCNCSGTTYIYASASNWAEPNSGTWVWGTSQNHDGPTSGSYNWAAGPGYYSVPYVSVKYNGRDNRCVACYCATNVTEACSERVDVSVSGNPFSFSTAAIKAPSNFTASDNTGVNFIDLSWTNNSDIPAANRVFRIYRDNVLYATVPGTQTTFQDSNLPNSVSHYYQVENYAANWNATSYRVGDYGSTYSAGFTATDGTTYGKTSLSWLSLAQYAANDLEITRDGQQIAVVSKTSKQYNDYDGVPGVKYKYAVAAIDANNISLPAYADSGYSRPNGVLKGNVRTALSSGVEGVVVTATATINSRTYTYTDTTDPSGFYEIRDVFYNTGSNYTLTPSKLNHLFNPPALTRNIDQNNNVASGIDFTDTTTLTIGGTIYFPDTSETGVGCPVAGVDLFLNGKATGIKTGANGTYKLTIQDEGVYTITPQYFNHKFDSVSRTLFVNTNNLSINFIDKQTDTLRFNLLGGCGNRITDNALVYLNAAGNNANCYSKALTLDGINEKVLILPAQKYSLKLQDAYANGAFLLDVVSYFPTQTVDLTQRDTLNKISTDTLYTFHPADTITFANGTKAITPAYTDTTVSTDTVKQALSPRSDFIYRNQLFLELVNEADILSGCSQYPYYMAQETNYKLKFKVYDFYPYDSTRCLVDTGQLVIYDNVTYDNGTVVTMPIVNGVATYTVAPGRPNISGGGLHPYQKLLQVVAKVGSRSNSNNTAYWTLVSGQSPRQQTFVTKTPELPFYVMHDPPGDASFAFLAKDSSVSYSYTNQYQVGGGAGPFLDLQIGVGIPVPFTGIVIGASSTVSLAAEAGRDNTNANSIATSFTATEQFSTSGSSDFIGRDGDVFVGGSFNMIYAITDKVKFSNCTVKRDTGLAWGANGLATTYVYTEKHIRETLIPQLELVRDVSLQVGTKGAKDTADLIQTYIDVWNQVLSKNRKNSDTAATQVKNISFSAGAPYDNTITQSNDSSVTYEYQVYLNLETAISAAIGDGGNFAETEFGVKANFHWNTTKTNNSDFTNSKTVGYHLEDGNAGDFFSVDVLKDKVYGTPAFKVVAGTSSCPHEENTQARDLPEISLNNYSQFNVPVGTPATYVANLTNLSESGETRTYNVQAVSESNLDGAVIKVGGQQVNFSPASFTVPFGQTIPVTLTVEPGPIAADYEHLKVSMSSPCDGGQYDEVDFEAHFQTQCSKVDIYQPANNWLVNAASRDTLVVILTGYDPTNVKLNEIGIEYRRAGQNWQPAIAAIPRAALTSSSKTIYLNVSNLSDGNYELRAYAFCAGLPTGKSYSSTLSGIIDRKNITLFGTPSPADGVLNIAENISVSFNETVDCNLQYNPVNVTLTRPSDGLNIPVIVTCNGSDVVITTDPVGYIDSFQNQTLTASVSNLKDINGNSLVNPIVWSFVVNRSQVYWNPSSLDISATQGVTAIGTGVLVNTSSTAKNFTLTKVPSWLNASTTSGTISAVNGTQSIAFTVKPGINPGTYQDTVIALTNGLEQFLFVTLDMSKPAPNWTVNPANFQYNMSIVANYSTTQLDAPLSTDKRDKIAVFKGNECRGIGYITYVPAVNRYVANITAFSNALTGDTFTFRLWDAQPGIEYLAKERLLFVADASLGQVLSPYILHPEGILQTKVFNAGWNWFSLNVRSQDMSVNRVLSSLKPANGDVVKTINSYSQYNSTNKTWTGSLTSFGNEKSYMIFLSKADTLQFIGAAITDTVTIPVAVGWNWIGYPRQTFVPVNDYLSGFPTTTGNVIKNQTEFANYSGGNWTGSLTFFEPGEGYKLKSATALNFQIPPSRSLPSWNVNENNYEYNMGVTGVLQFNNVEVPESHYLIGAFVNGTCIGLQQPEYIAAQNAYRIFLSAHGNSAEVNQPISFKVYDIDNDVEYTPVYAPATFSIDTTFGNLQQAYVLNINTATGINNLNFADGYSLAQNVPNPFSNATNIEFSIPKSQQVNITVYDQAGRLVKELVNQTLTAGKHTVNLEQETMQAGVYFYHMTAGEFSKTRRMTILK